VTRGKRAVAVPFLAALSSCGSCGPSLRAVPFGPPANVASGSNLVLIEDAPPPAKVEEIPFDPGGGCAWLDGRWEWSVRNWEWIPGDWVLPPEACHFSPPETVWVATTGKGQLFYLPGRWYPDESGGKCAAARSCSTGPINR
jgi:hypothetical protein